MSKQRESDERRRKRKRRYVFGPHLLRRRGKKGFWSGYIEGQEVALGTADRVEAQQRLHALAEERRRAEGGAPPPEPPLLASVALLFAEHCRPPRHTKATARTYGARSAWFVEWAEEHHGLTRMDEVSYQLMKKFIRARVDGGAKSSTVNRDLVVVRRLFAFGYTEGLIAENPFETPRFKKLKLREPRPKPNAVTLSQEQINDLITKLSEMFPPTYVAVVEALSGSGAGGAMLPKNRRPAAGSSRTSPVCSRNSLSSAPSLWMMSR